MSEPEKMFNPWEKIKAMQASVIKKCSKFVIGQRALQSRVNAPRVLWDSQQKGTYSRKKHGELK